MNMNQKSTHLIFAAAIMAIFLIGTANFTSAQEEIDPLKEILKNAKTNMPYPEVSKYPQITNQSCDALNSCPTDLSCYSFPGIGLRCAKPNPCSYYQCPSGTQCTLTASYPGQVICSCTGPECPTSSGDEDTVSFDPSTQTEVHVIRPDGQEDQQNVSLRQAGREGSVPSKEGILQSTNASAEYTSELIIKDRQLFMNTSVGEKPVNIMPEDAVSVSETPNVDLVQKIELKEESEKPVYIIKGTKQAMLFFLFPIQLEIETKIDASTGKVISAKKPWWRFLAF